MPFTKDPLEVSQSSNQNVLEESDRQQFKLPKITLPHSRGRIQSRKTNKVPKHLPLLSNQNAYQQTQNSSLNQTKKQQQSELSIKDNKEDIHNNNNSDFVMEVEQQLKNILNKNKILERQMQIQYDSNRKDEEEEELDFQDQINQNKQIIKLRRQQNQKRMQVHSNKVIIQNEQSNRVIPESEHTIKFNHQMPKARTKTLKPTKNQTLLQKKMKDYNNSLQNKFLQRKKQSIGMSVKNQKSLPRAASKKVVNLNDLLVQDHSKNPYQGSIKNKMSEKQKQKLYNQNAKKLKNQGQKIMTEEESDFQKKTKSNNSLFDNIHSFLQNPKRFQKHQKMLKQLKKKLQSKDINKIEQKIKQLNQKMGLNQNYETKSTYGKTQNQNVFLTSQNNMERTARDWKRVQIKDKINLQYHSSNFDKQIDYISFLQDKNTHSLSKFMDHQKLIVQMQLQRKFAKSIQKAQHKSQK